ncbi:hypothetical protein SK128_026062 [Halocaridina rubra]|uniref:Uncharacterized protein n=1 Tax=Halocaridina rubra TaxID=373956 RepID=A0AAN8WND1_HALRR
MGRRLWNACNQRGGHTQQTTPPQQQHRNMLGRPSLPQTTTGITLPDEQRAANQENECAEILKDLGSKIKEIEKEMTTMKEKIETLETKTDHCENEDFKEAVEKQICEYHRDEREKDFGRPNLILSGITESMATDPIEKFNDDVNFLKEIVKDQGVEGEVYVRTVIRRNPQPTATGNTHSQGKPRLLKVVVRDEEMKWKILKEVNKLKEMTMTNRKNVELCQITHLKKDRNTSNLP